MSHDSGDYLDVQKTVVAEARLHETWETLTNQETLRDIETEMTAAIHSSAIPTANLSRDHIQHDAGKH